MNRPSSYLTRVALPSNITSTLHFSIVKVINGDGFCDAVSLRVSSIVLDAFWSDFGLKSHLIEKAAFINFSKSITYLRFHFDKRRLDVFVINLKTSSVCCISASLDDFFVLFRLIKCDIEVMGWCQCHS